MNRYLIVSSYRESRLELHGMTITLQSTGEHDAAEMLALMSGGPVSIVLATTSQSDNQPGGTP